MIEHKLIQNSYEINVIILIRSDGLKPLKFTVHNPTLEWHLTNVFITSWYNVTNESISPDYPPSYMFVPAASTYQIDGRFVILFEVM